MKQNNNHTEALHHLLNDIESHEDSIDNMSHDEINEFLSDSGIDISKIESRANSLKIKCDGKMKLAMARAARISRNGHAETTVNFEIPSTKEAIISKLIEIYGNSSNIPLAARGFKGMEYEDYKSLYIDIMKKHVSAHKISDDHA